MKELFIRSISGLVYVMVIIASCLTGMYGQFLLVFLLTLTAMAEWMQLRKNEPVKLSVGLSTVIILLLIYSYHSFFKESDIKFSLFSTFIFLFIIILYISQSFSTKRGNNLARLFHVTFALIYIGIPMFLITLIPFYKAERINWILLSVFILIWAGDTFAYLSGRFLGKHKFFERISPNKTWEGFIGGIIFTLLTAWIMSNYFDYLSLVEWLGLAGIVSIFSTLGDLFESAVKRYFQVKDSGRFIPGHGGILDRIDSLLFALPAAYFYLRILENFNL